ncbi:MAG: TIR domain-containing protein [Anaerolineales bacterium]
MSDIFISYSRKDIAYARILHEGLQAQDLETWIDWQDIPPSTEWMQEIYTAIEEANTVVFILSASSILSEVCNEEIEHARENNKRIIPVVIDDVDPSKVHPALAAINWIFSRTQDELQPAIDSLIEAIQTDYDWVKAHTRLQVRALEWERERQDRSYLLHGTDLHQAEDWLAESVAKAPEPTLTQTRYIQFSRQEAMKRQRRSLISIGAALIITLVLGIIAVINGQRAQQNALSLATQVAIAEEQRGIAEEQKGIAEEQKGIAEENAHLAHIRELTAISQQSGIRFDVAMLLGAESFNEIENFQTSNNLFKLNLQYPKVSRIIMHEGVRSVAISPDGKILASGSADGSIMLWDMASVQPLSDLLRGHDSTVWTLDFSPDGKWLVSGSEDQMIILWDVDSGQEIERINTSMDIRNVAFSPDGRTIASIDASDQGGHVVLWDVDSMQAVGEPLGEFWGGTGEVAFSPDGEKLACGFGNVMIWDLSGEQPIAEPLQGNPEQVMTIAFNPDGKILATAGEDVDSLILLWDVESKQLIGEPLEGHSSEIISLAFSPDGDTLASGSRDRTIVLWNAASGQAIGEPLSAHIARISEIAFGPDGTTLASASEDDTIILWNVEGAAYSKEIVPLENSGVTRDGLSADGKILASVDDDGAIHLMDIESGQPFGEPLERQEEGSVSRVAFSPDMSTIASMEEENSISLWIASTGMRIAGPLRGFGAILI